MALYLDYFSHIKLTNRVGQQFNGGDNGTKLLYIQIMASPYYGNKEIYLIVPKGFKPSDKYETEIVDGENFKKIYVESLDEISYKESDALFIPLVCGREMITINHLKKLYPSLKVYGRVHDKNHNFPLDIKDRLYYKGINRTGIKIIVDWVGKRILFRFMYGKWISNFDKVFTVSNYSLQLLKHRKVNNICYYYQGLLEDYCTWQDEELNKTNEDEYILFVNGGRPEKNCLRAIQAFCSYKKEHRDNDVKLYITSTKKETRDNLLYTLRKERKDILKDIVFWDYVSYEKLKSLYTNCRFLLFPSKGEGFGLPVLESIFSRRPVLASWNTSIPEVAGSSVKYIDPFNVNSIKKGIEYYMIDDNLQYHEKIIEERIPIIERQIQEDSKVLIDELFR